MEQLSLESSLDTALTLAWPWIRTPSPASSRTAALRRRRPVCSRTEERDVQRRQLQGLVFLRPIQGVSDMAFAPAETNTAHAATAVSSSQVGAIGVHARGIRSGIEWRDATARVPHFAISETPELVGRASGAAGKIQWSRLERKVAVRGRGEAHASRLDGSQPDAWRYVIEVQDAGKPADVTGYR